MAARFLRLAVRLARGAGVCAALLLCAIAFAQDEADLRARALYKAAERESIKLTLTIVGDPTVKAATVIEVRGISDLLSGR